ncbi:multicopper oxidase domain-containing protein [Acidihalobacter yilgarnensis]|nr:multicopper oxidase domain-containing protein [Acidihalobacter yilgarnensis]
MDRRNFIKSGAAGLAMGALGTKTAEATSTAQTSSPTTNIPVSGTPNGIPIPGGSFTPQPGKRLDGGPGYNDPRNMFDGAMRMGSDISPRYTYENIPEESEVEFKIFHIDVVLTEHELVDGVKMHALAFNGQVPGPEIRVQENDWVKVIFTNKTGLMHTIHWHGLFSPYEMDGVPYTTQPPLMPGQQFVYKFRAAPYGTHFYHCHFSTPLHQAQGMHGAFIVEAKGDDPIRKQFPYTRDYTMVLEAFALDYARQGFNAMLERMKEKMRLMKLHKLTKDTLAVFRNYRDLKKHIKEGYIPPYSQNRNQSGPVLPNWNYFGINGKSYPATEPLLIKPGEWIRIRLINGGFLEHYMHLHGHDFYQVANDGAPLPEPIRGNTIAVKPGKTADIVVYGNNPGVWTFHDHDTTRVTNNGVYPGGMLTVLEYEGFVGGYGPLTAIDE